MVAEAGDLLKASNMGMAHIAPIGFPSFAEPARGAGGRRSECYPVSTSCHEHEVNPSSPLLPGSKGDALFMGAEENGDQLSKGDAKAELRSLTNGLPSRTDVCTRTCGPPRRKSGF